MGVDILRVDILKVDILRVDILRVDNLGGTQATHGRHYGNFPYPNCHQSADWCCCQCTHVSTFVPLCIYTETELPLLVLILPFA